MKKQLLFIALCLTSLMNAQTPVITFTSAPLTTAQIGSTITVNYQYSIASAGYIYCAINRYNDWTWAATVASAELNPAVAGTNVTGSFQLTIPPGTTPTASLTGAMNYKINIELKNSNFDWLAGSYPDSQINLTAPLSTSDFDKNTISVYPNPSNDFIFVKGIENRTISQVSIVDILGKNVFEAAEMNGNKIDISNLNTGIYILSITSDNKQERIKFIKK